MRFSNYYYKIAYRKQRRFEDCKEEDYNVDR
jgi:hypothetical protein